MNVKLLLIALVSLHKSTLIMQRSTDVWIPILEVFTKRKRYYKKRRNKRMKFKRRRTTVVLMGVWTRSMMSAFVTRGGLVHLQANVTNRKVSESKFMGPWKIRWRKRSTGRKGGLECQQQSWGFCFMSSSQFCLWRWCSEHFGICHWNKITISTFISVKCKGKKKKIRNTKRKLMNTIAKW